METSKPLLGNLLNKQIRYVVPVFQRHYVWTEEYQWKPLWEDIQNKIKERVDKQRLHTHFTGSIVLNQETVTTNVLSTYSVIDGQQRLTTFQLFFIAFREVCRKAEDNDSLTATINEFIFNRPSFGDADFEDQKYKLVPTKFDIDIFKDIADLTYDEFYIKQLKPILDEHGIGPKTYREEAKKRNKLMGAYLYFFDELTAYISNNQHNLTTLELIKNILLSIQNDFQFIEIGLSPNDDPQMIFETLNGRGASLTETDLIRNYIFMRADAKGENLDKIYDKYWDEYDNPESTYEWHKPIHRGRYKEPRIQFFLIDYLTVKTREEIRYDQVFYRYKSFIINNDPFESSEDELKELYEYSQIFKRLTQPSNNSVLEKFAKRLLALDTTTIFPLLMYIEGENGISKDDKDKIYNILDSYIVRRFICGLTPKNYNKVFLDFLNFFIKNKSVDKNEIEIDEDVLNIADSFIKYLEAKDKDTNSWPNNHILKDKILNRPIYREEKAKSRALVNIFLEIEYFIRNSKQETIEIITDNLTIEHVMPKIWYENWTLNGQNITEDQFNIAPQAIYTENDVNGIYHLIDKRNSSLNTFGNLTVLTNSLNPSVSNDSYNKKRPEIIKQSTLILNSYFQNVPEWNEEKVLTRGTYLYEKFINIWSFPNKDLDT